MTGEERAAKLAAARVELREAERTCRLLGHAVADPAAPAAFAARLDVEVAVAARRLELWQAVVAKLEREAVPGEWDGPRCQYPGPPTSSGSLRCLRAAGHEGRHDAAGVSW